mmetsp:Transcript_34157/g.71738  ORF Transcript_34157/g.71738 Transcript_34157/m.71738 type:complete len:242 (-) Transcript_34157:47-772(-)
MSLGIQVSNILCFGALGQVLMACFGGSGCDRTSRECSLDTIGTGSIPRNSSLVCADDQRQHDIASSGIADVIRRPALNCTENMSWLLSPDSSCSEDDFCFSKKQKNEGNPAFHCTERIVVSSAVEDHRATPQTQCRASDTIRTLIRSPDRDSDRYVVSSAISPLKSRYLEERADGVRTVEEYQWRGGTWMGTWSVSLSVRSPLRSAAGGGGSAGTTPPRLRRRLRFADAEAEEARGGRRDR